MADTPHYSGGTALDLNQLPCFDFSEEKSIARIFNYSKFTTKISYSQASLSVSGIPLAVES